jgi:hypothetical protein
MIEAACVRRSRGSTVRMAIAGAERGRQGIVRLFSGSGVGRREFGPPAQSWRETTTGEGGGRKNGGREGGTQNAIANTKAGGKGHDLAPAALEVKARTKHTLEMTKADMSRRSTGVVVHRP